MRQEQSAAGLPQKYAAGTVCRRSATGSSLQEVNKVIICFCQLENWRESSIQIANGQVPTAGERVVQFSTNMD